MYLNVIKWIFIDMWQKLISIQALCNVDSVLSQQATRKGEFQYIDTYIVT